MMTTHSSGNAGDRDPNETISLASGLVRAIGRPERIGRYRILRVIGEGGMGTVYEAEQDKPRRTVALKVIKPGYASPQLLKRFEQESQVLGRLQHPGIAQIYEAGTYEIAPSSEGGKGVTVPYFAMEFIRGQALRTYVESKSLGTRERLELVAKICDAVHHAHQKGVIHRDLKPGNILVDESGQPKILDFGVARATDSDIQATTIQTDVGQLVGTIPYMSPEQVSADPNELDTRSDVYALGVITYELLAGRLPYDLKHRMIHEAVRVIREEEPTPLSTINRVFRGDVETIVAKSLEKDKARRYQSAAELAADIRRYMHNEPIVARPASAAYQFKKFAQRHKAVVVGVAAVFIVLVAGIIASTTLYLRAEHARIEQSRERERAELAEREQSRERERAETERDRAETQRDRAEKEAQTAKRVSEFLVDLFKVSDPYEVSDPSEAKGNTITAREILDRGAEKITRELTDQPVVRATLLNTIGKVYTSLGLHVSAQPLLESALTIRRQELGAEHLDVAESLNNLGSLLHAQGKFAEAEPLFYEALAMRRKLLGDENPDVSASLVGLAYSLVEQAKPAEAEPLLREALAMTRKVRGDEHSDVAARLLALANLLREQGKLAEAEPLCREALSISRKLLGGEHPNVVWSANVLGMVLAEQGKIAEAEPLYREALAINRKLLGDEHPKVATCINNLGCLLMLQGKLAEAEAMLRQGVDMMSALLGKEQRESGVFRSRLGECLTKMGRFEDAEGELLEAHRVLTASLTPQHWRTVRAVRYLVALYEAWDVAEPGKGYAEQAAKWRACLTE